MLRLQKMVWACAISAAMLLGACSHNRQLATLQSGYDVYDTGMTMAAEMHANGQIDENQWKSIAGIARRYKAAYKVAIEAYWQYEEMKDYESEQRYLQALQAFQAVYAEFVAQIREVKNGKEQTGHDRDGTEIRSPAPADGDPELQPGQFDDRRFEETGIGNEVAGRIP